MSRRIEYLWYISSAPVGRGAFSCWLTGSYKSTAHRRIRKYVDAHGFTPKQSEAYAQMCRGYGNPDDFKVMRNFCRNKNLGIKLRCREFIR